MCQSRTDTKNPVATDRTTLTTPTKSSSGAHEPGSSSGCREKNEVGEDVETLASQDATTQAEEELHHARYANFLTRVSEPQLAITLYALIFSNAGC